MSFFIIQDIFSTHFYSCFFPHFAQNLFWSEISAPQNWQVLGDDTIDGFDISVRNWGCGGGGIGILAKVCAGDGWIGWWVLIWFLLRLSVGLLV